MSSERHDNLRSLFETFMDAEQARQAAEDVRGADELFRRHPAPAPSREVLLRIKARGAVQLSERRRVRLWRRHVAEAVAAAALLVVVASVGLKFVGNDTPRIGPEIWSKAIWETDSIVRDDANLAYISTEIEQIEEQFKTALSPSEQQAETPVSELYEMEMELIAMETDFWKG